MAYTKNPTWVDGDTGGTRIDAADLNHMEDGLEAAAAYTSTCILMTSTWGTGISCPDTAALDIVGDLDVRIKLSLASWNVNGTTYAFASKTGPTSGQWSWIFNYGWNGELRLKTSANGTAWRVFETGSAKPSWVNTANAVGWLRVALDVDNGASGATASFYESVDGATWTLISAITTSGVASIFAGTGLLAVGSDAADGDGMVGKVYSAEVRNGIGGTVVASWKSLGSTSKSVDPQGNIWSITTNDAAVVVVA